jgi:hypothetical protein
MLGRQFLADEKSHLKHERESRCREERKWTSISACTLVLLMFDLE